MTEPQARPSLHSFLVGTPSRTGDPYEVAAMAEMSGYSVEDAVTEGWPDIFAAAQSLPVVRGDADGDGAPSRRSLSLGSAFLRGLIYTAPVLTMWSIFPTPVTPMEIRYIALLVVLSWGGSMMSNYVVGEWLWTDRKVGWKLALTVAVAAIVVACALGWSLTQLGVIGAAVAAVGAIQVAYFFCASPLMLRKRYVALGFFAVLGATAGVTSMATELTRSPRLLALDSTVNLSAIAVACLLAPAVLLVRQTIVAVRWDDPGRSASPSRPQAVAFGSYGLMFGCLVLWGPVVAPSSLTTVLMVVIVAGIGFAEVVVAWIRNRADALLGLNFETQSFTHAARSVLVTGVAMYVVPVAVATVVLAGFVTGFAAPTLSVLMSVVTVVGLAAVQVLSLIGMAMHAIRGVAVAITAGGGALVLVTPFLTGPVTYVAAFLCVVSALSAILFLISLERVAAPINHI